MSLRTRTTLLVAVVTAVLLVGGAVTLDVVLRHRLTGSADDLARSRVADLLTLAESGGLPRMLVNVTDDSVAQVVDEQGRVVAASAQRRGRRAPHRRAGHRRPAASRRSSVPTTTRPRTTGCGPRPDPRPTAAGYACTSAPAWSPSARRPRACASTLVVGVPLVWLLLVGASWLLVGRALRRLDRIRAEVDAITEDDLSRRVGGAGRAATRSAGSRRR